MHASDTHILSTHTHIDIILYVICSLCECVYVVLNCRVGYSLQYKGGYEQRLHTIDKAMLIPHIPRALLLHLN